MEIYVTTYSVTVKLGKLQLRLPAVEQRLPRCVWISQIIHLCNMKQRNAEFQFNVLTRFLTSSTCFEPHGLIIRKTVCTRSYFMLCFSCIYVSSLADGLLT